MKVLVTGGAGFIGSHIVDALLGEGHTVAVVDDLSTGSTENIAADATFFEIDISNAAAVRACFDEFLPDAICHQAAQMSVSRSVREPAFDAHVNLVGLLNLLENAVRVKTKSVVFASSGGVLYGEATEPSPEDTPANPISPYGISKWASEKYLEFFVRQHGLRAVALRYSNVFGPRQNPHGEAGVVAIFANKMLAGEAFTINGDGRYVRDFVYVDDVVRANLLAIANDGDGFLALNVGTGEPTDINQLAAKMRDAFSALTGKPTLEPESGPARDGDLRSNLVSSAAIKTAFGWQPEVDVDAGLKRTIEWFTDRT